MSLEDNKQVYIEKLRNEIAELKNQLSRQELRQKAKKSLFGSMSVERLAEENKTLREELRVIRTVNPEKCEKGGECEKCVVGCVIDEWMAN